jgi:hypothetical protein
MPERLVDVEKEGAKVLHTFSVTISPPAAEEAFKQKALEAAGHAKLVQSRSAVLEGGGRMVTIDLPKPALPGSSAPSLSGAPGKGSFVHDKPGEP